MVTKDMIFYTIRILITNTFSTPEVACKFFEEDGGGKLKYRVIVEKGGNKRLLSGLVSFKLSEGNDKPGEGLMDWKEFREAMSKIKRPNNGWY